MLASKTTTAASAMRSSPALGVAAAVGANVVGRILLTYSAFSNVKAGVTGEDSGRESLRYRIL